VCQSYNFYVGQDSDGDDDRQPTTRRQAAFTPDDGLDAHRADQHMPDLRLRPGQAILLVTRGPIAGSWFELDGSRMEIGRSDVTICLHDATVSRRHALIERRGGVFWIEDLGALNGVSVNGRVVNRHVLHNRDVIQVGLFKLVFVI